MSNTLCFALYWSGACLLKLTALLVPVVFLLLVWLGDGSPAPADAAYNLPGQVGDWANPLSGQGAGGDGHPLYTTYSIIVATFLGTMGLPHVVVRFYTNPDGRAARRTTLVVLGLLGMFYVLPPVYGALGRVYAGELVAEGRSDAVVLELPARMIGGTGGELLAALLIAGAFGAFLSTSSGLTVAVAGVVSQDVVSRWLPGVLAFRVAAIVAVAIPYAMAVLVADVGVATAVGLAFAVAASTFCPLLVLGIWSVAPHRRGSDRGAAGRRRAFGCRGGAHVPHRRRRLLGVRAALPAGRVVGASRVPRDGGGVAASPRIGGRRT